MSREHLGVLVARFQTPELDAGGRALLDMLSGHHDRLVVFLGVSPIPAARFDPLDFAARRRMLHAEFPELEVRPLDDVRSDARWSEALDTAIGAGPAVLYGSRAGLVERYHGRFPTITLDGGPLAPPDVPVSGQDAAFRRGVMWATQARYPGVLSTVDIAIFTPDFSQLLLARKPAEGLFRFVGGFSDPDDPTYEFSALREVEEETGLTVSDPVYIASFRIVDWRYRHEVDCVKTHLFGATVVAGTPRAMDDIAEVRFFDPDIRTDAVMEEHRELLVAARRWAAAQRP